MMYDESKGQWETKRNLNKEALTYAITSGMIFFYKKIIITAQTFEYTTIIDS